MTNFEIYLFTQYTNILKLYKASDGQYFVKLKDAEAYCNLLSDNTFTEIPRPDNLPPMPEDPIPINELWVKYPYLWQWKGELSLSGTSAVLPTPSADNRMWVYRIVTTSATVSKELNWGSLSTQKLIVGVGDYIMCTSEKWEKLFDAKRLTEIEASNVAVIQSFQAFQDSKEEIETKLLSKIQAVNSISALQSFAGASIAYFDGSTWEKKTGNVTSNGGSYAGTLIRVNSTTYWERNFESFVNVKWFGAKGDNSTDDYSSINNAVTYCTQINSGSGIVLYFPTGIYLISQKITMPNRVGFQGANGRGTVIKPHSTFSDSYMLHAVNGTTSMFASYLKDFYIDARGKNMTSVVYSQAWQETCGMERVVIQFDGTTQNGFEYANGYGGAAFLNLKEIEIFSESTNTNAKGIKINQISLVGGFVFSLDGCTITGGTNILPVGIYSTNDVLLLRNYHVEYVASGVKIAGATSLSADTYTGSFNSVTNLIELQSGFSGIVNLKNIIPNGATTYTLKDNVNSRHITTAEGNIENYNYDQSAFSSYVTSDITGQTGDGTEVSLVFGTKNYDYKNEYNPTNGVFTAKKAGKYLFNITTQINLPAGSTTVLLYINTTQGFTEIWRGNADYIRDGSNNIIISGSAIMNMSQNDSARVYLNVYGIGAKTVTLKATKSKFLGSFLYR